LSETSSSVAPLVELSRDIEAGGDTVWGILTTPERFSTWMNGKVEFEARAGSPFRAEFPDFQIVIAGEIVTLDREARHLGLTWGIQEGPQADVLPAGSSFVEFRVHDTESGCRVELKHSRLPSDEFVRQNQQGWRFHLSRMALSANRADLEKGLERTLAGWFTAWNERDDAARLRTLEECCSKDIEFQDDWASAQGLDLLSQHISNCFKFMPGWKLEPTGDLRICRGEALVGWRGVGPDGSALEGHNHVRADWDGTLRRVAGFQVG
jgi:uncharacterized protein YndB with AHSA1/START domain